MKNVNVEIIAVMEKSAQGSNGKPYSFLEVTYKEFFQGKPTTKGYKALKFNTPEEVWDALSSAKNGDNLNITMEKNEKGYFQWLEVSEQTEAQEKTPAMPKAQEYKEQEDRRQTMIVRQSSLKAAVDYVIADGELTTDTVLAVAEQFEAWVMR